jgi:hypothetical protein
MTNLLQSITGTKNLFINCVVAIALSFIAFCLLALVGNFIIDPGLINNASFGL